MATAPRQASLSSGPSNRDFPPSSAAEPATVEESSGEVELISLLREAAMTGARPLESIVDALADAARVLSGADGTALGLDDKGMIVCRARSGNTAPPIGAPISAESGISGECLRTATMLVCHDAMTDPRVDTEVCRSLGIRSVAAIPVRGQKRVAGILEAFSARPNAFDGDALAALRDLAAIAETAYRRELAASAPPARPQPEFTSPAMAVQSKPTSAATTQSAREISSDLSQPGKNHAKWAIGAVAALLLTVGVGWWAWHTPGDEAASTTNTQNVHAASPDAVSSTPALQVLPKPAPGLAPNHSDRSRNDIVKKASEIKPIDLRGDNEGTATETSETIEVRAPKGKSTETSPAPEPPSVSLAPSANPDTLARLSSGPIPMPVSSPRISQGVTEARLIHRVEPVYPTNARMQRLQGKVTLSATIGTDGSVRQVKVVEGPPVLAESAKEAVQKWKYNPANLNGTPVEVQKEIVVMFVQP
jgi:TonB family protein